MSDPGLPPLFRDALPSSRACVLCAVSNGRRHVLLVRLAQRGEWHACPVCDAPAQPVSR